MFASLSRRSLLFVGVSAGVVASCAPGSSSAKLAVFKTPICACCTAWVDHIRAAGFKVEVTELTNLRSLRTSHGVSDDLASCHTALIAGYVLEGHVPAEDVRRLLEERPIAIGLAVPGMPLGSPGMETPDHRHDAFTTLLVLKGGGRQIFARHDQAQG